MLHYITPYEMHRPTYVYYDNIFTEHELDILQNVARNTDNPARVGSSSGPGDLSNMRRSYVRFEGKRNETEWLYERLSEVISTINVTHFQFDLTGLGEDLQFTNYKAEDLGYYDWHQDSGSKISRKLSLSILLTDPSEYEGGNLIIAHNAKDEKTNITANKKRGLCVFFPSYIYHKVEPVTKGSRQSLVSWISGPPFR